MNRTRALTIRGGRGTVELRTEGVMHVLWKPNGAIEAADVHAAIASINAMCEGLERPMLVDLAATEAVCRDARSMVSTASAASRIALLGSSPVDRLLATLLLGGNTPPRPVRFFTSRKEAIGWLAQDD